VRAALRADPGTRNLNFAVDADRGEARLRGLVETREEWNQAARVTAAVPGVKNVKNELRVTSEIRKPMGE
jgi:osmotically-inducible protein OsmY